MTERTGQDDALDLIAKHKRNENLIESLPNINLDEVEPSTMRLLYDVFEDIGKTIALCQKHIVGAMYKKLIDELSEEKQRKYNDKMFRLMFVNEETDEDENI